MKAERVAVDLSGLDQFRASALLTEPSVEPQGVPRRVPLDLIDFDPTQPRRRINPATLAELAETIKLQGVLEPVSLRSNFDQPGRYIVNRGERRVRASRLAEMADVPAFIDERIDPYAQVIENDQREDLSLFDLATFVAEREAAGDARADIARRLGKSRSLVTELAALGEASAEVRQACESGRIADSRSLYLLARAPGDRADQVAALLASGGSITRSAVEQALAPSPAASAASPALGEQPPSATPPEAAAASARSGSVQPVAREAAKKLGNALQVEHEGRKGWLSWARQPSKRTGEVVFEDGTTQTVNLQALTLLAWTTR